MSGSSRSAPCASSIVGGVEVCHHNGNLFAYMHVQLGLALVLHNDEPAPSLPPSLCSCCLRKPWLRMACFGLLRIIISGTPSPAPLAEHPIMASRRTVVENESLEKARGCECCLRSPSTCSAWVGQTKNTYVCARDDRAKCWGDRTLSKHTKSLCHLL
eukprot:COSAG01_NODE_11228_length_1978_cov_1.907398_2_plen_157_part_01